MKRMRCIFEIHLVRIAVLLLIMLVNAGCGNPSQKKLPKIFDQTDSLAILSVPDYSEPRFYPSSEFIWDQMWGGLSKGGVDGYEEVPDYFWEYEYYPLGIAGLLYLTVRIPVGAIGGGISEARQMPHLMKCHFRYILCDVFEGRNPCAQVAGRIQANCEERKPELNPHRVYWSDREGADYRNTSSGKKRAKMKEFCTALDESGLQMILVIERAEFGLMGGTMADQQSCFFMVVQTELIRGKDGKRIYRREFEYTSPLHRFDEWEGCGMKLLREHFDQACGGLADGISKDILGVEKNG